MHSYTYQVFWNLIATSVWISLRFETSFAVERPLHLASSTLLLVGLFWAFQKSRDSGSQGDIAAVKHERLFHDSSHVARRYGGRVLGFLGSPSTVLAACVVLRAAILRSIVLDVHCSWEGVELVVPVLLALHELNSYAKRKTSPTDTSNGRSYLVTVVTIASPVLLAIHTFSSAQNSTYICPAISSRSVTHFLQIFGACLDAVIIIGASKIIKDVEPKEHLRSLSHIAIASAWLVPFLSFWFIYKFPEQVTWSLRLDRKTVVDLILASLLCANFVASAAYLLRGLRPVTLFTVVTFVMVYFSFLHNHLSDSVAGQGRYITLTLIIVTGLTALMGLEPSQSRFRPKSGSSTMISRSIVVIIMALLASTVWFATIRSFFSSSRVPAQPITTLINNARATSSNWHAQAGKSKSLKEATIEYQRRYQIPPPPGFDKWYAFAISRNSTIIDDFGQIHHDLLPFWGIPPSKIREMTAHMIDRPWTQVAGLRIFNGTTEVSKHMPGTHRWMVDSAAEMINTFSQWLPNMDLGFNLNDENRAAIPWADMETLMKAATIARTHLSQTKTLQSSPGNSTWGGRFMEPEPPFPSDLPSESFTESSLIPTFETYSTLSCPSSSPALTQKWWKKASPCAACNAPHSLGPYISNWTLAASVCHQPDLANLHGFHLSPSSFKGTTLLFPIFSQSKIPSFSDIIFPSPWNYIRKVGYEPTEDIPFAQKNNTFFWRGATSEGYAIRGSWKGMQRQRFVHFSNHTLPSLLLESKTAVNVSVSFVQEPTRCMTPDCNDEIKEFDFAGPVEWKEHWKHKYLLDVDGAGFSGRFLPFLESKSLVFRAAGFRQWFEERLTPWRDFVPLDAKAGGDLGGLLSFFYNDEKKKGSENGGKGKGEAQAEVEAERIASEGGELARRVLRKEDMEVYMFRLLLEWGRIVDDRRGELGFVFVEGGSS